MVLSEIGRTSAGFILLMCLSSYVCIFKFERNKAIYYFSNYRYLLVALFLNAAVILISSTYHGKFSGSDFERALRLGAGVALLLGASLSLNINVLKQAAWGFLISVWVATYYVVEATLASFPERPDLDFIHNAVTYGNVLIIVTAISSFSMGWRLTPYKNVELIFKFLTVIVGLIGLLLTQTRGAWLAVPVFIMIGSLIFFRNLNWKKLTVSLGLALLVLIGTFTASSTLRDRLATGFHEISECISTNTLAFSSMCNRIQLWHASLLMFKQNPLLGSGSTANFSKALPSFAEQKIVSQQVAKEFGEPHNEFLQQLSAFGLFGFIALLMVYVAPGYVFLRRIRSQKGDLSSKIGAGIGLSICTGFFIFGLTELMFRTMHMVSLYAVMVGWALALSDPNHTRFCTPLSSAEHNFSK
ncbi:MAG: O-antigen ligase family protein [Burkholderiaceae bacterium]|nr:O-antigen ligase family protein [Burkholderiaceae bacterium]